MRRYAAKPSSQILLSAFWQSVQRSRRMAFKQSLPATARRLTRRSRGGPTACHQGPPAGTVYIVCRRALASPLARTLGGSNASRYHRVALRAWSAHDFKSVGSIRTKFLCKPVKPECKPKAMEPLASRAWRCKLQLQGLSGFACSLTLRSRGGPTACHRAPSPGTLYIFCSRGPASHRRPPP
jgi:hypothetical protein